MEDEYRDGYCCWLLDQKQDFSPSVLSYFRVVSVHVDVQMCVCTLLIYTASVLGTTPKGDTGEGPNWACKKDCPLGTLITLVFLHQTDPAPTYSSDSFCSAGLQSPAIWGFYSLGYRC